MSAMLQFAFLAAMLVAPFPALADDDGAKSFFSAIMSVLLPIIFAWLVYSSVKLAWKWGVSPLRLVLLFSAPFAVPVLYYSLSTLFLSDPDRYLVGPIFIVLCYAAYFVDRMILKRLSRRYDPSTPAKN
ncbi:hypothetical protein EOI86_16690 [Hwanghaeella grinnelliae]|uniref:Uncharacterized protein n=1 Tax=Hwanghaeella grinnelliae TaxID=2500179 RepID=A0A3S2VQ34_9PROT|nr:hypothetical protein [Hwanghaeella grinnelliae]RVU36801.1 hypothetical protein EOI86_16690 [Hwanghaeella grinnelliae]